MHGKCISRIQRASVNRLITEKYTQGIGASAGDILDDNNKFVANYYTTEHQQ